MRERVLKLPPLEMKPLKFYLGEVYYVFDEGGEKEVVEIGEIQTSPRCSERLYTLSDGQKIIVTNKKSTKRPAGIDGVLCEEGSELVWIAHKRLDELYEKLNGDNREVFLKGISESWKNSFSFKEEQKDSSGNVIQNGLRLPQIGALHAIGAHWSLYKQASTIVMPTGTGKTETMLAMMVAYRPGKILVIVPSRALRDQTVKKFKNLGLLRKLGNLSLGASNPVVGVITKQPRTKEDLDIFRSCNVLVATMSSFAGENPSKLWNEIAKNTEVLIIDEAHHIGAKNWGGFREYFYDKKILQFTATPYRRDGKLVDGKVIYDYPLGIAQREGYFRKISFYPIHEIDREDGDRAIAEAAIRQLREDDSKGFNHIIMARCENIQRAEEQIFPIYRELASDLSPIVVHSESKDVSLIVDEIRAGKKRIVVCVNMLGEGFDLPELKIAAVHDTHKSLGILLQFTGRFTRSVGESIGNATVIANIADQQVSLALERLYSEDADWNQLLNEYSSQASKKHAELVDFLNSSKKLNDSDNEESIQISHQLLRPKLSTLVFNAKSFDPKSFFKGLSKNLELHGVWLHEESNTLYFVSRSEMPIQWTRSRQLKDRLWNLFVLHFDTEHSLLFLGSSDKDSLHENLAKAVGAETHIYGDVIFRSLGRINRLIFQNIGVRKHGRRNLSYALYTGSDVAQALSLTETGGSSIKSNLSGSGWEEGRPITIGCSYKGRIWTREPGTIPEFVSWCHHVGAKIKDESIKTEEIMENVLIPELVEALPDKEILSIEWPNEILRQSEERVVLTKGTEELAISMLDLHFIGRSIASNKIEFEIVSDGNEVWSTLVLIVENGDFKVVSVSGEPVKIKVGIIENPIEEYFSNYPPLVRFVDLSELDGNLLIVPKDASSLIIPNERFEGWQWDGVDIQKESIWKNGNERRDSIQWRVARQFIAGDFSIVFDDDGAGEAADLVCIKEEEDSIRLALIHCKFTKGITPGERVKDIVEVSSQAIRSAKWKWKFKDLCRHIAGREKRLSTSQRPTRFLNGDNARLNEFVRLTRFKEIRPEIIIVQPGLSIQKISSEQTAVLASAYSYLKETIGVDLDIICSD